MSRSCHTARLGSLASSRMMESAEGGSCSAAASATVSATVSAGVSEAATSACSGGGTSQAVSSRPHRRRAAEDGRDVMVRSSPAAGADEQVSSRREPYRAPSRAANGRGRVHGHRRQGLAFGSGALTPRAPRTKRPQGSGRVASYGACHLPRRSSPPLPGPARISPFSYTTSPRRSVVTGQPVTSHPE